jgi:hypothetical protein
LECATMWSCRWLPPCLSVQTVWLTALVQYLRRLFGRLFGAEYVSNVFQILHHFRVTFLRSCHFVLLWSFDGSSAPKGRGSTHLKHCYHTLTVVPVRSPHHTNRSTYSERTTEEYYKGQNFLSTFLSLQTRKSNYKLH